jgi:carotenoid cleavage dioxygenase
MDDGHISYDGASGFMKFDLHSGSSQTLALPKGVAPSEPLYIPSSDGSAEDDGYVFSYVYEPSTQTSDLWVLDAHDISKGPIAKVKLPVRVPIGFHGVWVPENLI